MRSAPGEYHGFLWFYFINEQLLRFLNMRYPRDYDTVPRLYFWLFHLLWLFPWSVYFPRMAKLSFKPVDRAGKTRLLALCWTGFIAGVFHIFDHAGILFDAVLSGAGAADGLGDGRGRQLDPLRYARSVRNICGCRGRRAHAVFPVVESSDAGRYFIGAELQSGRVQAFARPYGRPDHPSFAYLRLPLLLAALAFLLGAFGTFRAPGQRAFLAISLMAILFFQAARIAMAAFDPYLSSRPLAEGCSALAAGKADCRSSLLHVLVDLLSTPTASAAAQRPVQQPGVRLLRAWRAECLHRRRAVEEACGWRRSDAIW
jgi:hypothetical protein